MGYRVTFANQQLSDYCKILNIKREVIPSRENFSKSIPSIDGSLYNGYRYGERNIVLEVALVASSREELVKKSRELAKALDVKYPSVLILGDEPDKYYYAVPNGSVSLDKKFNTAQFEIEFICHNPIAYSRSWDSFLPDADNIFSITNKGTTSTYPYLSAIFKQNACFFQCTNYKGETVLIGQPKDSTKPNYETETYAVNDNCQAISNFTSLSSSLLEEGRLSDGVLGVGNGGNGIVCTNYGNSTDGKWNGGAAKRSLNTNITDFSCEIDIVFSSQGNNYSGGSNSGGSSGGGSTPSPTPMSQTYKVCAKAGLHVRERASINSTSYGVMPYGKNITVTEVDGGWGKHSYNGRTGWSSLTYLEKTSSTRSALRTQENIMPRYYAEEQMGIMEIIGYDKQGGKLFICQIKDANEFYEFVEPRVFIGSQNYKILDQGRNTPEPRKIITTDDYGKETVTNGASGVFGDFNDCVGKFVIKRETKNKQQMWHCSFYKYQNGSITHKLSTSNWISNNAYPKTDLNSIGIYIGKYGDSFPVSIMSVENICVARLNHPATIESNETIFKKDDVLNIDFASGEVTKNGVPFLNYLDVGSEFFEIPEGKSQVIIRSDDKYVETCLGIQKRYL